MAKFVLLALVLVGGCSPGRMETENRFSMVHIKPGGDNELDQLWIIDGDTGKVRRCHKSNGGIFCTSPK